MKWRDTCLARTLDWLWSSWSGMCFYYAILATPVFILALILGVLSAIVVDAFAATLLLICEG